MPILKVDDKVTEFVPNCVYDENRKLFACRPILRVGDRTIEAEKEVLVKIDGGTRKIIDEGGAPEILLEKLDEHFKKFNL